MINFRRQCYQRDSKLVELLTEWGVLDTEQLHYLLFPSIRVAQRRLTALYNLGKIKRNTQTSPYFYYMVDHKNPLQRIAENWVRIYIASRCSSWQRTAFSYDAGIYTITNTVTGAVKEYRITNNKFKLPSDNIIVLNDEWINKIKGELKC